MDNRPAGPLHYASVEFDLRKLRYHIPCFIHGTSEACNTIQRMQSLGCLGTMTPIPISLLILDEQSHQWHGGRRASRDLEQYQHQSCSSQLVISLLIRDT